MYIYNHTYVYMHLCLRRVMRTIKGHVVFITMTVSCNVTGSLDH